MKLLPKKMFSSVRTPATGNILVTGKTSVTGNNRGSGKHSGAGRLLVVALFGVVLSGCSTIGYYSQIVSGHMRIVLGKRSVEEVVADESVDDSIKHRLNVAQQARKFAINSLELPDNQSYTSFYDTGRGFVTWNVIAAEEFSFQPRLWCFPIAGCVSYRGYYSEENAQRYADGLDAEGLDVAVNGATAYSTLGWFRDPLLNTMLERSDPSIASLLFHELAHQQLYVSDDSTFNESFATFVENEGLKRWQEHVMKTDPQLVDEDLTAALALGKQRRGEFINLLSGTRDDLTELYESEIAPEQMREQKRLRFDQMREDYALLKASWEGYEGYDRWFDRKLNNARLVAVGTYNDYIPAFQTLFERSGRSFPQFFIAAKEISKLPLEERTEVMQQLGAPVETSASSQ